MSPIESVQLVSIRDCDVVGVSVLIRWHKQPDYMDLLDKHRRIRCNCPAESGRCRTHQRNLREDAKADGLTELQSFERRGVLMMRGGYREGDSEGIPIHVQGTVDRVATHPVDEAADSV